MGKLGIDVKNAGLIPEGEYLGQVKEVRFTIREANNGWSKDAGARDVDFAEYMSAPHKLPNKDGDEKAARKIGVFVSLSKDGAPSGRHIETFWGVEAADNFYANFAKACGTESDDTDDLIGCQVGVKVSIVDPGGDQDKENVVKYNRI